MDTPIHQLELVRPWRTATLVAAGIAAVELALLVVAGIVLARALDRARTSTPPPPRRQKPPGTSPPRRKPHLATGSSPTCPRSKIGVILILNGNGIHGRRRVSRLRWSSARGYAVNAGRERPQHRLPDLAADVRPRATPARRSASCRTWACRAARVGPLDGMKPAQLHGAKLVLILGATKR